MSSTPRPARPASLPRRAGRQLLRALGRRHSLSLREPLARPVDRARSRAWLAAAVALAVGLAGVVTAALVGYRTSVRTTESERGRLHRIEAAVIGRVQPEQPANSRWTGGYENRVEVSTVWTAPDGRTHAGTVQLPRTTLTRPTVTLWVDDAGEPARTPETRIGLTVGAVCTGLAGGATLATLIGVALALRLRALDRRADRDWQRSWARWEPRWSGRTNQPQED
ncbi:Rv1733c family protein [Kitasatospora sp. NBC_00458]|uniref:Rv1733c family protein n=1 Tax=Kitasatospora sp. NBC_00458 TaxID=2903568 RepID=UPI002E17256E